MKNTNVAFLIIIRLISAAVGFISAVSFVRAINRTFNAQISWLIGQWFNFGQRLSILLLSACLTAFVISIWLAKKRPMYPLRKVDYLYLLVFCVAGFVACARVAWQLVRWGAFRVVTPLMPGTTWTNLVILPMFAYILALLALGELTARLRDKSLFSTIYWVKFFGVYSVWRPVGFTAIVLLTGQFVLMIAYFRIPLVLVFTLVSIGALTYLAAHMLNLAAEYDKASVEKIQAERFKSELITNVSHDIKTPLTSIINYVDLLTTLGLQGQAEEYVNVLVRKSSRLKTLIEDLMEASKAGTGNLRVESQAINLVEIVGQVAGEFEDSFEGRGLTLVMRQPEAVGVGAVLATGTAGTVLAEGNASISGANAASHHHAEEDNVSTRVMVYADSRHLYRTLENLFSNASKYAQECTRVFAEITPMPHDGTVFFTLQNTSAAPIEMSDGALTEQFIRGDKARNTEGSGLGLYIAKSLVELMGGSLDIRVVGDLFWVEVELCGV